MSQQIDLTQKQETFACLVSEGQTYADAYRRAYKVAPNTKDETIWVNSSKLMTNNKVILRINKLKEENQNRNQVSLDEVLSEMKIWLKFNIKTIFNENDTMKSLSEMTDEEASSIASYEVVELFDGTGSNRVQIGYLKKVRLLDKKAVAEMFLKKMGAFITKLVVDTEDLSHVKELLDSIKK
jgi:hypothetical protein